MRKEQDLLKAPFPYFGGKSRIATTVWRAFGPLYNYVEPFCGSAAMLLARSAECWPQGKIAVETVNDMDAFISCFWRAVKIAEPEVLAELMNDPVNEDDLEARHKWLVKQPELDAFRECMKNDPDFYDVKRAAWWCWGLCQNIGGGWCAGEWFGVGDEKNHGQGTCNNAAKMPYLGRSRGVHRQMPHLGDAGMGECERRGEVLRDRLRNVRVCCGDWLRVCGSPATTTTHGLTGVFLDPPYSAEAGRDNSIYGATEDLTVAHRVREWCLEHGDDPLMRIGLCGYEGEGHEDLESRGWKVIAWKSSVGYGKLSHGGVGRDNSHRERIWLSPHCLHVPGEVEAVS